MKKYLLLGCLISIAAVISNAQFPTLVGGKSTPTTNDVRAMVVDPATGGLTVAPTRTQAVTTPAQTSVTTVAAQLVAVNTNRKELIVQNTGTTVLKVAFGSTSPTQTAYHFALRASTSSDDGSGGVLVSDFWQGAVQIISSGSGGTCVVTEIQ